MPVKFKEPLRDTFRRVIEEHGQQAFAEVMESRINEESESKRWEFCRDFGLRELWEATVGPVERTTNFGRGAHALNPIQIQEAVASSAFPTITTTILSRVVKEKFTLHSAGAMRLVDVIQSNVRSENVAGTSQVEYTDEDLEELQPYEQSSLAEQYVTMDEEHKRGKLIVISEEAIFFDRSGVIRRDAAMIGEVLGYSLDGLIIDGITGNNSNVYKPAGTAATLYAHATYGNFSSSVINLVDWTDIDGLLNYAASNLVDDQSRLIDFRPTQLVVSRADEFTALRILNATEVGTPPGHTTTAAFTTPNPVRSTTIREVISSPRIDAINSDDWYLGNFPRQFVLREFWPLRVFPIQMPQTQDVGLALKARYYAGINAANRWNVVKADGA